MRVCPFVLPSVGPYAFPKNVVITDNISAFRLSTTTNTSNNDTNITLRWGQRIELPDRAYLITHRNVDWSEREYRKSYCWPIQFVNWCWIVRCLWRKNLTLKEALRKVHTHTETYVHTQSHTHTVTYIHPRTWMLHIAKNLIFLSSR